MAQQQDARPPSRPDRLSKAARRLDRTKDKPIDDPERARAYLAISRLCAHANRRHGRRGDMGALQRRAPTTGPALLTGRRDPHLLAGATSKRMPNWVDISRRCLSPCFTFSLFPPTPGTRSERHPKMVPLSPPPSPNSQRALTMSSENPTPRCARQSFVGAMARLGHAAASPDAAQIVSSGGSTNHSGKRQRPVLERQPNGSPCAQVPRQNAFLAGRSWRWCLAR